MYHIPILRVQVVREGSLEADRRRIAHPADAASILREYAQQHDREVLLILLLNTKHDVTGIHQVSMGTLSEVLVQPREVFKAAILGNAAAIIAVHNHPSGDTTPSREDRALTDRLQACGALLGIPLLDHVIIGEGVRYFSFREAGWVPAMRQEGAAADTRESGGPSMKPPVARQDLLRRVVPFPFNELKDPLTDLAFYDVMKPLLAFCTGIAHVSSLALRTKAAHTAQVADALECLREQLEAAGAILGQWGDACPRIHTQRVPDPASGEEEHG